jgi:hypothetical protein
VFTSSTARNAARSSNREYRGTSNENSTTARWISGDVVSRPVVTKRLHQARIIRHYGSANGSWLNNGSGKTLRLFKAAKNLGRLATGDTRGHHLVHSVF